MLRDRLTQLRRQAGAAPLGPEPAPAASPSLAARIARLQVRRTVGARLDDAALAERLGGAVPASGLIELRHRFALGRRHGHRSLTGLLEPEPGLPRAPAGGDWLFLDTETSGLSGGTGTLAFLLGLPPVINRPPDRLQVSRRQVSFRLCQVGCLRLVPSLQTPVDQPRRVA